MPTDYAGWADEVRRFCRALERVAAPAAEIGQPAPDGEEWFELLQHKLLPQLDGQPLLVVAVVGGTNIGKSVVFNHLAGETASAVSPLAAGTRHPVCLVPPGFDDAAELARLFAGFQLCSWRSPQDPLCDTPEHLLFWRVGRNVPPRLLLLDTPDVDSDARVNWQRADQIRQSADVLVAVLTQQKYNDAAVKEFFRKAVAADKPVIVVFNQCDLEQDRSYWPQWLETFCRQTGAEPELVYVVPYDRRGAAELRLAFHDVGPDGRLAPSGGSSLRDELASLHFDAIKIRTFRGAMCRVLDPARGAGAYLARLREASGEFEAAARVLSQMRTKPVAWPQLPARLLVEEVRQWWDSRRTGWTRRVHGFYRTVGESVVWPVRAAVRAIRPPVVERADLFQAEERRAVVQAVESLLDELKRLAEVGNETLKPRVARLLTGDARQELLERVEAAHAELPPIDDDYRRFLRAELDRWEQENARAVALLRSVDRVLAFARPAVTVSLVASGWLVAGGLVHDAAVQAVGHSVSQLATEAVITGGIAGGGEALVTGTGEGVKQAAARLFGRLQVRYAEVRGAWLADWLERELLGGLLAELSRGASVPQTPAFIEAERSLAALAATARLPVASR